MSLRDLAVAALALVLVATIAITALTGGGNDAAPAARVAEAEALLEGIRETRRPPADGECGDLRDAYREARAALEASAGEAEDAPADAGDGAAADSPEAEPADSASLAERLRVISAFLEASC